MRPVVLFCSPAPHSPLSWGARETEARHQVDDGHPANLLLKIDPHPGTPPSAMGGLLQRARHPPGPPTTTWMLLRYPSWPTAPEFLDSSALSRGSSGRSGCGPAGPPAGGSTWTFLHWLHVGHGPLSSPPIPFDPAATCPLPQRVRNTS